jgi:hypothetical protein
LETGERRNGTGNGRPRDANTGGATQTTDENNHSCSTSAVAQPHSPGADARARNVSNKEGRRWLLDTQGAAPREATTDSREDRARHTKYHSTDAAPGRRDRATACRPAAATVRDGAVRRVPCHAATQTRRRVQARPHRTHYTQYNAQWRDEHRAARTSKGARADFLAEPVLLAHAQLHGLPHAATSRAVSRRHAQHAQQA